MSSEIEEPICIKRTKGKTLKDVFKRISFDENASSENTRNQLKAVELETSKTIYHNYHCNEKSDPNKDFSIQTYPSLPERGVPEGQEDPKRQHSYANSFKSEFDNGFNPNFKNPKNHYCESFPNAKASLVKTFLKSVGSKPALSKRALLVTRNQITSHLISNLKPSDHEDYSILIRALSDEVTKNSPRKANIKSLLKAPIVDLVTSADEECTLYKVNEVLTVEGCPVLAVITSKSLCFVGYCDANDSFVLRYSCSFENLVAAVVGPFSQLVIVFNENKERFFLNTGLSDTSASEIVSRVEVAMRRWCIKAKKQFNFSVAQIQDIKHMGVFHKLLPKSAFSENEVIIAQYSAWLQEDYVETTSSPLGPEKEGYLMTRIGIQQSWIPSYLCLKGGVLYLFEKNSQRIPQLAVPLRSSFYKGCRMHSNADRPHTFEILVEGGSTFDFGAADNLEMMEWIGALYSSAMQVSIIEVSDSKKESALVSCFVTLSTDQILLHRFPDEIISRAFLNTVTSFTKSSSPNNLYCLLELGCREASEMGGDWILYFISETCFKSFCSRFAEIANPSATNYQVEDERFLTHQSDRVSARIRSSWDQFFV